MKKLITIALVMVLALSFAACGGSKDGNPPASQGGNSGSSSGETSGSSDGNGSGGSSSGGGQAVASLIKWMKDGRFSYDYTMISEGPDGRSEGTGSMAMDGDKMATSAEMTVEGQLVKSRTIKLGNTMYVIDDGNKFIMEMSGADAMKGMIDDYSGITPIGSGTGEINGRTLPYEEYKEDELGATVKYFLDGGEVYGTVSEYEGYKTTMIIRNPKNSAPAGAFDLPKGYTSMGGMGDFNLNDYLP